MTSRGTMRPALPPPTKRSSDSDMLYTDVERELEGGIINKVTLTERSLKIELIDGARTTYEFYVLPSPNSPPRLQVSKEKRP